MATVESSCRLVVPWPRVLEDPDVEKDAENWKTLERWVDHLLSDCLPASSGSTPIWCRVSTQNITISGGETSPSTVEVDAITQTLDVDSTCNVQIVINTPGSQGGNWQVGPRVDNNDYTDNSSYASLGATPIGTNIAYTSAITLPAGSHTFGFWMTANNVISDGPFNVGYQVVVIAGTDTGDTCMSQS